MQNENPFASPQTSNEDYIADFDAPENAETIRRSHLSREANIQSLGVIFLIGAALFGVIAIAVPVGTMGDFGDELSVTILVTALATGIAVLHGWIGIGLRRLNRIVRIPAALLCVLWLFSFGLPTIISIVGLIMLVGQKADYVFSPQYQQVIAATPQVKLKTSKIVWAVLFILIAVIVLGVVGMMIGFAVSEH